MSRAEIFEVVKKNIQEIVEGLADREVVETDSMEELGADSLEVVEVVSRSMKELKIRVPRAELTNARNIKELVDLFEKATLASTG
ncbi:phosphopantetheine-binding protein [Candidatus Nitronereus thalassa]|uniref:Phosphopantetheine-binding protein n=1 Tax=Candidatus Nitronereus thalassa TaxID=3020898 RepID=A0ABU3K4D8_9BACT|nr:phosphopantetheine-binding protein [Candidatus Nitronereus thalassa]MDT7041213.1 phosphopantetheine-binding protein [Candidatus Nitronereus thalassa]